MKKIVEILSFQKGKKYQIQFRYKTSFYESFCRNQWIILFLIIHFYLDSVEYSFKEFRGIILFFLSLRCTLLFSVLYLLLLNLMVKQKKTKQKKKQYINSLFCLLNSNFNSRVITTLFLLRHVVEKKYTANCDMWQNKARSIAVYPRFTCSKTVHPFIFSCNQIVNFSREGSFS